MRSFGYGHLDLSGKDLFLFLHTAQPPPPDLFARAIGTFEGHDVSRLCFLAVTDGGSPDAKLRSEHSKFLAGRALHTAVVTDQALVRGVVTAISWFNPHVRAFSPQHLPAALVHLDLAGEHERVLGELARIQRLMDPVRTLELMLRQARRPPLSGQSG